MQSQLDVLSRHQCACYRAIFKGLAGKPKALWAMERTGRMVLTGILVGMGTCRRLAHYLSDVELFVRLEIIIILGAVNPRQSTQLSAEAAPIIITPCAAHASALHTSTRVAAALPRRPNLSSADLVASLWGTPGGVKALQPWCVQKLVDGNGRQIKAFWFAPAVPTFFG